MENNLEKLWKIYKDTICTVGEEIRGSSKNSNTKRTRWWREKYYRTKVDGGLTWAIKMITIKNINREE